jgi:NAD(P)H-hydrate epimerase
MAGIDAILSRKPNTNKSDYGHILILGGSRGLAGAAVLCANSAMRTGAGLVTLSIPKSLYPVAARRVFLEVMTKPLPETSEGALGLSAYNNIFDFCKKADVLAIGPGLSKNLSTQRLVRRIITNVNKPLVIDADGLNALVGHLGLLQSAICNLQSVVLTPHPGEFSRLTGKPVGYIQKNRERLAKLFASDYNTVLVLKGYKTVVAAPHKKVYINYSGNPGMATAGSGDCLTGMIAALLGQGLGGFEAARLGVYLHGLAGDLAAREKSQAAMIASDIIDKISDAIKNIQKQ